MFFEKKSRMPEHINCKTIYLDCNIIELFITFPLNQMKVQQKNDDGPFGERFHETQKKYKFLNVHIFMMV